MKSRTILAKTIDLAKGMNYHISNKGVYLGIGVCQVDEKPNFILIKDSKHKEVKEKPPIDADEWDFAE